MARFARTSRWKMIQASLSFLAPEVMARSILAAENSRPPRAELGLMAGSEVCAAPVVGLRRKRWWRRSEGAESLQHLRKRWGGSFRGDRDSHLTFSFGDRHRGWGRRRRHPRSGQDPVDNPARPRRDTDRPEQDVHDLRLYEPIDGYIDNISFHRSFLTTLAQPFQQ